MKCDKYITAVNRIGILFIVLLIYSKSGAQKLPLKVVVSTRAYYQYQWTNEASACDETINIDTTTVRCSRILAYNYPYFNSLDKNFAKIINEVVRNTFDCQAPSSKRLNLDTWQCPEDKPSEDLLGYKIYYNSDFFLSFTIFRDMEPGGLGNGFRHDAIPFTFDLENKKQLKLGDIIYEEGDTTIYGIIISQLKTSNPNLFQEFGKITNPSLFQPFSTLASSFIVNPTGITLYYPLSFGGKYSFEEIKINFSEYSFLFKDKRILKLKRTYKD